jgi:hypothetical protein
MKCFDHFIPREFGGAFLQEIAGISGEGDEA